MQRTSEEKTELFERTPIRQAALTLIVPTVISQLVMLVYNMADTWFIGQTGDPHQVAAVTVTYPIFMMMNALANCLVSVEAVLFPVCLAAANRKRLVRLQRFSCGRRAASMPFS